MDDALGYLYLAGIIITCSFLASFGGWTATQLQALPSDAYHATVDQWGCSTVDSQVVCTTYLEVTSSKPLAPEGADLRIIYGVQ